MKRRNRMLRKALLMVCCALTLVAISVGATLAYLTDTEGVINTFTVGQVGISLDELDTDNSTPGKERDHENVYHLIPGKNYIKDPTVHVDANSEPSWLFVKVENGISDIEIKAETETGKKTIAAQIAQNGWKALPGVPNVFYCKHAAKQDTSKDYLVFSDFTIDGASVTNAVIAPYKNANVKVTAYAIQMAGFDSAGKNDDENAKDAWVAGKFN